MGKSGFPKQTQILPALIFGAGGWYLLDWSGPVVTGEQINPLSAAAALILGLSALSLLAGSFQLLNRLLEWMRAKKPTGLKGTAGFVKSLREIKRDLAKGWAPYWGSFRGKPIFSHFEASAFCVGPSGSGKSTKMILTNAMALKGYSKIIIDFKSDLTPMLAPALRDRGETVRILNLGGLFSDIIGESDQLNPLHVIADEYFRPGGLRDVTDTVHEMCLQLLPEPKGDKGRHANSYFDDGSRDLIAFAIQMTVLVKGYEATMADVAQLLSDRHALLQHARWAAGRLQLQDREKE